MKKTKEIIYKCIAMSLLIIFTVGFTACNNNKVDKESKTYADLDKYFKLSEYKEGDITYEAATEGQYAVVINGEVQNTRGIFINNKVYMDIEYVGDYINDGIYWDSNEEISLYALPYEEIKIKLGDKSYTTEEGTVSFDSEIVVKQGNTVYVLLDYVKEFTAMDFNIVEGDQKRIVVNTRYGETGFVTVNKAIDLRTAEDVRSDILTALIKDQKLRYKSAGTTEEWCKVETEDGMQGYVKVADVSEVIKEDVKTDFVQIIYPSIKKDFEICLGWQQMEYAAGNDSFANMIKGADSLNVISPTWFKVSDASGNIRSLASSSYVKKAHNKGIEVWPLISDFDMDEDEEYFIRKVLPYTSKRKVLIENIMEQILECGADGINIDFEKINYNVADDYIQFLRELSIQCRKEGIVLSVDNYANGTSYYNRKAQGQVIDYCIIMGYDEHWSGSLEAGSVASLPFVENGIKNTIAQVPAEKVINAIPFFTRVWAETPEDMTDGTQTIIEDPIYGNYALSSKAVGLKSAINLLEEHGINKVWLEQLGQYYGEYVEDGITYRIWLEEEESISKKLELIDTYGIAGMAAWKLGLEYDDIWDVIDDYID